MQHMIQIRSITSLSLRNKVTMCRAKLHVVWLQNHYNVAYKTTTMLIALACYIAYPQYRRTLLSPSFQIVIQQTKQCYNSANFGIKPCPTLSYPRHVNSWIRVTIRILVCALFKATSARMTPEQFPPPSVWRGNTQESLCCVCARVCVCTN